MRRASLSLTARNVAILRAQKGTPATRQASAYGSFLGPDTLAMDEEEERRMLEGTRWF